MPDNSNNLAHKLANHGHQYLLPGDKFHQGAPKQRNECCSYCICWNLRLLRNTCLLGWDRIPGGTKEQRNHPNSGLPGRKMQQSGC